MNESSHSSISRPRSSRPRRTRDQLVLGGAGHVGQHVELGPAAEDGGRLDEPALARRQAVELAPHQLGQRPRQRLAVELGRVDVAGHVQDLLEEERVAAGAAVERVDEARRRHLAVDGGEEGADLGPAEALAGGRGGRSAAVRAARASRPPAGGGSAPLAGTVATTSVAGSGAVASGLEHGHALGVGPVEVLEHDAGPGGRRCAPAMASTTARADVVGRPAAGRRAARAPPRRAGRASPARPRRRAPRRAGGSAPMSSWTRRVLPTPASPVTRATAARPSGWRALEQAGQAVSGADRPTMTGSDRSGPPACGRAYRRPLAARPVPSAAGGAVGCRRTAAGRVRAAAGRAPGGAGAAGPAASAWRWRRCMWSTWCWAMVMCWYGCMPPGCAPSRGRHIGSDHVSSGPAAA